MASSPITSWQIDGEKLETVADFIFLGSKITGDGHCSREIKGHLLLGRKAMTNLVCMLSHFSHVQLFATPWTVACQAPLSMGFSARLEYWSGLPCPPPGDLPDPRTSPALANGFFTTNTT